MSDSFISDGVHELGRQMFAVVVDGKVLQTHRSYEQARYAYDLAHDRATQITHRSVMWVKLDDGWRKIETVRFTNGTIKNKITETGVSDKEYFQRKLQGNL